MPTDHHGLTENQRQVAHGRRLTRDAPAVGAARPARHERDEVRLRRRALRRLHRARGWNPEASLRDAGGRRRRPCHHHHRSHRRHPGRQEGPASLARSRGYTVRLLPIRPDHGRRCVAREDTGAHRYRYRPGDVGQHLSLRHLSAHPRGHQARGADAVRRQERSLIMARVSRRQILTAGAATGGGLLLGWHHDAQAGVVGAAAKATRSVFAPNAFIRIATDGRVTLIMCQVEMGQGTYTSMPMLLAEELEVGLDQVRLEHAPPDDTLYANAILQSQTTGLSSTIRAFWMPLRQAGAMARTMLVAAAAKQWSVDVNGCQAQRGAVVHPPSSRRLTYGELVDAAATLPVPARESVVLKPLDAMSLIGRSTKRIEGPEKVNGRTEFGIDVRLPGMKIATVAVSPVLGGRATRVDERAALAVRGVRQVVNIDEAVAVVADHMWAARKGLKAAAIQWDDGPHATVEMTTIVGQLEEAARHPGAVARNEGDVDKALAGAAQRLDAVYQMPFLAHAAMEPMNCTVHYTKDGCDLWLGTQAPTRTQSVVADLTGLPKTAIRIHNHFLGGGFGRRLDTDATLLAVKVARNVDGPVKVVWSREEDIRHGMYRPYYYDRVSAGLDANGHPIAWTHRIAGSSVAARS